LETAAARHWRAVEKLVELKTLFGITLGNNRTVGIGKPFFLPLKP
jgi:hypothetical protein